MAINKREEWKKKRKRREDNLCKYIFKLIEDLKEIFKEFFIEYRGIFWCNYTHNLFY